VPAHTLPFSMPRKEKPTARSLLAVGSVNFD
jgi:hypothetical protein